jgi:hypothetical protein
MCFQAIDFSMFHVWKTTLHTVEAAGSIPATPTKKLRDSGQLARQRVASQEVVAGI